MDAGPLGLGRRDPHGLASQEQGGSVTRPIVAELLANPEASLNRGHLRELGLERRAVDAVSVLVRSSPSQATPGR